MGEHGRQQLESFRLAPWASRRRRDLLELMDRLNPTITELSQAIEQEVEKMFGGAATDDASRSRFLNRTGLLARKIPFLCFLNFRPKRVFF